MGRIRGLVIVTAILFGVLGGVGIKYLVKLVDNQQNNNTQLKFNQFSDDIMSHIKTNLTAFSNYLTTSAQGINQLYNNGLTSNITQNDFQRVCKVPELIIGFKLTRVFYARIINSSDELSFFVPTLQKIYNNSNFLPYNNFNGTPITIPLNTTNFPLLLAFVTHPIGSIPGLLKIGSVNFLGASGVNVTETLGLINSLDRVIRVSKIITTIRIDGVAETHISMSTNLYPWIGYATLNANDFLQTIMDEYKDIGIDVLITADENDTIYKIVNQTEKLSSLQTIKSINFQYRTWKVMFTATQTFVDNNSTNASKIILALAITALVVIVLGILIVGEFAISVEKQNMIKKELDSSRKIEAVHQSNRLVLHEIRNLSNAGFSLFKLRKANQITVTDFTITKDTFERVIGLTTNILDFEQLLSENYVPKQDTIDVHETIKSCFTKYIGVTIEISHKNVDQIIIIDNAKLQELIINGLSNAVKFAKDNFVRIKVQNLEHSRLLIEIINWFDQDININFEERFIPFFMKGDDNELIWSKTINNLLTINKNIYGDIQTCFSDESFENKTIISKSEDTNIYENIKSSGLGLSIARLIAKALGGECGVDYDNNKKMVRFWCLVNYQIPNEITNI